MGNALFLAFVVAMVGAVGLLAWRLINRYLTMKQIDLLKEAKKLWPVQK